MKKLYATIDDVSRDKLHKSKFTKITLKVEFEFALGIRRERVIISSNL